MKLFFVALFSMLAIRVQAQHFNTLKQVYNGYEIKPNEAVIYGNFVARVSEARSPNTHVIKLQNQKTGEILSLMINLRPKKLTEKTFVCIIPPGTYTILYYWWPERQRSGNKIYQESIYKGINSMDILEKKVLDGQIKVEDLQQFSFTISPETINYVGTWYFDTSLVSFTDDKEKMDISIKNKYKKLDLTKALTVIPD